MMQAHKRKIEKRVYSVGDTIGIPAMEKVSSGFMGGWYYRKILKPFKINYIINGVFIGEYL